MIVAMSHSSVIRRTSSRVSKYEDRSRIKNIVDELNMIFVLRFCCVRITRLGGDSVPDSVCT